MGEKETKTPEQRAEEAVNKKLRNAMACRLLKIRRCQAAIKKLEKEIKKIKEGELVPEDNEDDGDESLFCSCGYHKKEKCSSTSLFGPLSQTSSTSLSSTNTLFPKRK